MRGFRGSRAAQNAMSFRFGRNHADHPRFQGQNSQFQQVQAQQQQQRLNLPDWVKTPETRALENQQPQSQPRQQAPLRLVVDNTAKPAQAAKPAEAAKLAAPKAAAKTVKAAKAVSAKPVKAAGAKASAPKAVAAARPRAKATGAAKAATARKVTRKAA